MGFFGKLIGGTLKIALTPIAVVKDVVNVVTDNDVDATENLLSSAVEDLGDATDDLCDGEL